MSSETDSESIPTLLEEKKLVPKFRSQNSIAAAAESTGTASRSRNAVINNAHIGSGSRNIFMPGARMLMIVVM